LKIIRKLIVIYVYRLYDILFNVKEIWYIYIIRASYTDVSHKFYLYFHNYVFGVCWIFLTYVREGTCAYKVARQ